MNDKPKPKIFRMFTGIVGLFTVVLFLACIWEIDARANRVEANVYRICVKEVGANNCYRGTLTDPAPGLF